jgi:hypothetical protein
MPDFVNGLFAKAPNPKAPDFVKGSISIKRAEFMAWLDQQQGDWVNIDVKESKGGKWYAQVNDWKPEGTARTTQNEGPERAFTPPTAPPVKPAAEINVADIPF